MLPWRGELAGRIDEHEFDSTLLRDNPLGDPATRPLLVYTPPGYDDATDRYPTVYVIQGYTGFVTTWHNRSPFRQPFMETADAVFATGEAPPALVVYVDAWTAYGGSQFVDSPGTGPYLSYLCDEIVPWVDRHYRTVADRDHRALMGKSSGGYGAMVVPMLRPEVFGAFATHAGDALFEVCWNDFPRMARALRDSYNGSIEKFLADFRGRIPMTKELDGMLIMLAGCAAAYSARPDGGFDLPFDAHGARVPEVWQRWLSLDPVLMAGEPRYAETLRSMRAIWIDAGKKDEFYLDLAAEAFRAAVAEAGVPDEKVYFELFDAGHGGIDYRYPLSLAWLCQRMSAPVE